MLISPPPVEMVYQIPQYEVSLRNFSIADIDDFMEWATDEDVAKTMMWNTFTSRRQVKNFFTHAIKKHPWFKAICFGNKVIGSITLNKTQHTAELGYVIAKKYWGNGITTRAVQLAVESAFHNLGIATIEAYVDPDNIASQRVLEKNGFAFHGLLKNHVVQKGVVRDRMLYTISK